MKIKVNNLTLNDLFITFSVLLICISVISYSWNAFILALIPFIFFSLFFINKLKIFNVIFILNLLIIIMILYTVKNQIFYIEWARNMLFIPLMASGFFIGQIAAEKKNLRNNIFKAYYFSALFVVFYTMIIVVPQDFSLFIGERRGYWAKEYLLFGRTFPFSMGVTHLNMYITLALTLVIILVLKKYDFKNVSLIIVLFFIALSTQSRSPLLFMLNVSFILAIYHYHKSNNKFNYIINFFVFSSVCAFILVIYFFNLTQVDITQSERVNDLSRFYFYAKGLEHMSMEPFGNSLIDTDEFMPMVNYHNTFLAIGNRFGVLGLIFFITSFFIHIRNIKKLSSLKHKYFLYLLTYFCFHNFMLEDVIKFDYFVLLLYFILISYTRRLQYV